MLWNPDLPTGVFLFSLCFLVYKSQEPPRTPTTKQKKWRCRNETCHQAALVSVMRWAVSSDPGAWVYWWLVFLLHDSLVNDLISCCLQMQKRCTCGSKTGIFSVILLGHECQMWMTFLSECNCTQRFGKVQSRLQLFLRGGRGEGPVSDSKCLFMKIGDSFCLLGN